MLPPHSRFGRTVTLAAFWLAETLAFPASLELVIDNVVARQRVQPASIRYQTAAGEDYSITRISYLLSGFALERMDGSLVQWSNQVAWMDAEHGRHSVRLAAVPDGDYRSLRFLVGLETNLNNADVAKWPAEHPLNPNVNGLHWSWQGGYVFMAIEGLWRSRSTPIDGWSFHLARDTNVARVTLPVDLTVSNGVRLRLDFDVAALLNAPRSLSFATDGSSTHSRDGDPIAAALKANVPGAFRMRSVEAEDTPESWRPVAKPLYMTKQFTPYRFEMSATFPLPSLPRDNPLIEERVALGKVLFHEPRLSRDNSLSCASCHEAQAAFADPRRFSVGVSNRLGSRNAMPLFNLAWKSSFFWDGRAASLREQVLMPIQDHNEMDEFLTNVARKLGQAGYASAFQRAFASSDITAEKIALALEQFVLSLTSFDSKFDRVLRGDQQFSAQERRGLELFMTEFDPRRGQYGADCFHCHGGPLFQSQAFANNGLNSNDPALSGSVELDQRGVVPATDRGRARVTGRESDSAKFATPSLRNVELTAPYMHDGRFATLEEVVEHYSKGVKRSPTLDPNLAKHPQGGLHLAEADKQALVAFLKTLTDPKFRTTNGSLQASTSTSPP